MPVASEEDVLLREVDEDLSRDKTMERFRRYRVPAAIGAISILAVVAGYQVVSGQQQAEANRAAVAYADLSFAADAPPSTEALAEFASANDTGYGLLAALRAAAELAQSGDVEGARDLYAEVYTAREASAALKDFARIRAAYALFDNRPSEAASIASLVETEVFRPYAEEIGAGAALAGGAYQAARAGFEALAANETAPASLRTRARALSSLADAGVSGAELMAADEPDPVSFIEQFGQDLEAAGIPVGPSPDEAILPLTAPQADEAPATDAGDSGEGAESADEGGAAAEENPE